jgi:cytochrome P450
MALHPEKQRKAQEEIDRIIGRDRLPVFQDRESLVYVEAIYREVFRWLPPLPMIVPHISEADDVYKGYFIPKGSIFIISRNLLNLIFFF